MTKSEYVKFTDTSCDILLLRTVFCKHSDAVASYKHWHTDGFLDKRNVRGYSIMSVADFKFCFEL